jgi:membrane protein
MVAFPRMRIRRMPSLKVTFYIFFFTMMLMMLYALFVEGRIRPVGSMPNLVNLVLLGLLPTALSNVTLIFSLKQISSTTAAILGAFEPMTAMGVGILVFGEPFTLPVVLGFALILVSVLILVLCKKGVK